MRDDDVKPLFDLITSEQPPLGIDIGRISERGRRTRRRRKTLAVVGSSAAVCGAIVLSVFALADRAPVEPATRLPTSTVTTTTPSTGASCYLTPGGPCPQNGR
ncbi:hypothetical protein Lesp02_41550 [Lentzea sp. NBRC 105346]|uniref:hypothetical protein n=1 Tax=Lentzea sp. NBRC 105346 TaxID=3032205 RepID=UPI0024A578C1|nr:hypothetical protein [Lentzea sp. NBRC 105346]GLZ31967.1 hypothetical protein Lesp02_41550 [Lentzea sp. NBRC 105346]